MTPSALPGRARRALADGLPGAPQHQLLSTDDWATLKLRDTVRRACLMAATELMLLARLR